MTLPDILKIAAGVLFVVAGVWQYRRRSGADNGGYGSQSGVILLVVGVIVLIYALGGLEYRPSQGELDAMAGAG